MTGNDDQDSRHEACVAPQSVARPDRRPPGSPKPFLLDLLPNLSKDAPERTTVPAFWIIRQAQDEALG